MTIEITEDLVGIWFVGCDPMTDWTAGLTKTPEGFQLTYRFRYYVDNKSFDSKDKKSWSAYVVHSEDKEKMLDTVRKLAVSLAAADGGEIYECLMGDGGTEEFMEKLKAMSWTSVKTLTEEEAIEQGYVDGPEK